MDKRTTPADGATQGAKSMLAPYTNYFEVGQNRFEFLIDFGQFVPEAGQVRFHTRIATGPMFAKLLLGMIECAVNAHEAEHGPIRVDVDTLELPKLLTRSLPDVRERLSRELKTEAKGK